MKVRIVYTILLFVFSLCSLTSIAQLPKTKEKAHDEYTKANKKYNDAKTVTRDAYIDYNEADKARSFLESVKNDIELENRDNWEDLKEGAIELVADLGQVAASRGRDIPISSMAATAINGVGDIADWHDLQGQLSSVNSGLSAETANTTNLWAVYESALQIEKELKERSDLLYNHWLSFTSCAACNEPGAEHDLHASCWNSKWGCSETNVWSCTHDCDYEPVHCSGCNSKIANETHRSESDKALHKQVRCPDSNCNLLYYLCDTSQWTGADYHRLRTCYRGIYSGTYISGNRLYPGTWIGYCGNSYRHCNRHTIACRATGSTGDCW